MMFVLLTKRLFGWDWVRIKLGFGDWKTRRVRRLWDGCIYCNRYIDRMQKLTGHDWINEIWLTCPPSDYGIGKD